MPTATAPVIERIKENVDRIQLGERTFYLVGTAHVSEASAELAEAVIRETKPESVAVELCDSRYNSLKDPNRWREMNLVTVIRDGKAYLLMAQLMLAGFQKKLGRELQVRPGAEMMRAIKVAEELQTNTVLADRDIGITLKRTWSSLGFVSFVKVTWGMLIGLFSNQSVGAEEIEKLKTSDALESLLQEFSKMFPDVRRSLIDERDSYLACKIANAPGKSVVAVIGAGHVPGILRKFGQPVDLIELETVPPPKLWRKIFGWSIPALLIGIVLLGFFQSGADTSAEMVISWALITAISGSIGALIALAHPITIIVSALVAPITVLHPFLAAGWFAGLSEAMIRKPRVSDLETIADDISSIRGIWNNRVSRILLVIASTNLAVSIGAIVGAGKIVTLLGK